MKLINLVLSLFIAGVALASQPRIIQIPGNPAVLTPYSAIWAEGQHLASVYGSRPPYSGLEFAPGEPLTPEQAIHTTPYLLSCESGSNIINTANGCVVDDNGELSCGPGQFQAWTTFWEPVSGIYGDPNASSTAIAMMLWGLEKGYLDKWSCARILGIIGTP